MSFAQEQNSYQFTINNNGDEAETYELSVDKFSEYITFDENPISIAAGKSSTIVVEAAIPCENEGKHSLNLIVYIQKSKKTIKIPFDINAASCYGYEIQTGEKVVAKDTISVIFKPYKGAYELCLNEKISIPILIVNKGQPREFRFKLQDIDFAGLSGKKLFLQSNQRGVVYINIEPGKLGNYSFNLNIMTDKVRNITIHLDIKKCSSVGVAFGVDSISVCGCEPYSYDFFVGNEGIKEEEIKLELEGPGWASLGLTQNIQLEAGEVTDVALNIDAPCTAETYSATVTAYLADKQDARATDSVDITILSKDECYETRIEAEDSLKIDYNGTSLPVKVTNYGSEQIAYSLILDGPEWVNAENNTVSLEPKETKTIRLDIKPAENAEERDYDLKITLSSEKASYSKDVRIKLRKKGVFFENIAKWYGNYKFYLWTILGALVLTVFSAAYIISKKQKEKKGRKKTRRTKREWIMLAFIVLILAALAYLIGLFGPALWQFIVWYRYYLYTIIIVIGLGYIIARHAKKIKSKKIREKKKTEKTEKSKRKYLKYSVIISSILILAVILVYFLIRYNSLQYIAGFLLLYYPYIIAGIILLVVLILLLKLGTEKDKKSEKKRKKD